MTTFIFRPRNDSYYFMKEEYLHYVFKKKMLGKTFTTTDKRTLEILTFGEHNVNAGPDFLDAKIKIDGQIWAGPIEFHVKASDWYRHKHQNDLAYNNVIAHFVYQYDKPVYANKFLLPAVEIKDRIKQEHYKKYAALVASRREIHCQDIFDKVPKSAVDEQKQKSMNERLWDKALLILRDIESSQGDRTKAYHLALARIFGGKVNQMPFESLIERVEMSWLAKLNRDPFQIEALFLGMSGLIPDVSNHVYTAALRNEFNYQKKLFGIVVVPHQGWKYARMRPHNFPAIRLAQLAALINKNNSISNLFDDRTDLNSLTKSFELDLNPFWNNHFSLGHVANQNVSTKLSKEMVDLIIINAVIPFVFAIGLWEGNDAYNERAIDLLKQIKPEKNSITRMWKKMGVEINSAYDSQSLLQLKKQTCSQKKCLFCALGKSILNR